MHEPKQVKEMQKIQTEIKTLDYTNPNQCWLLTTQTYLHSLG